MKIGLSLEVQDQVKQVRIKLVDDVVVHFRRNLPRVARELPEARRALRAPEVA